VLLIHAKVNLKVLVLAIYICKINHKFYQDDNQMMVLNLMEHVDVDEDENEEEMNVTIIHHKQT
jgi:hypothetical protein